MLSQGGTLVLFIWQLPSARPLSIATGMYRQQATPLLLARYGDGIRRTQSAIPIPGDGTAGSWVCEGTAASVVICFFTVVAALSTDHAAPLGLGG